MNRLKEMRQAKGWTQKQLGDRVGMAKTTISGYERGNHQVDPSMLCALCDLFECSADYLLGRTDNPGVSLSAADQQLLQAYRRLPLEIRKAVDGLLAPYTAGAEEKKVV